jgi:hypothetical protein
MFDFHLFAGTGRAPCGAVSALDQGVVCWRGFVNPLHALTSGGAASLCKYLLHGATP